MAKAFIHPSKRWFPASLTHQAAWFRNFTNQFEQYAAALGFMAADILAVQKDNAMVQFLASSRVQYRAWSKAMKEFRIGVLQRRIGEPLAEVPPVPTFVVPDAVPSGVWQRLIELVERIRSAPAYTSEIGAAMHIIPSQTGDPGHGIAENELKPKLTAAATDEKYTFRVRVPKQGQQAFKIEFQRSESQKWEFGGIGTANPFDITIEPSTPGQPERILVRTLLMNRNKNVGQYSDLIWVTVNP